MKHLTLEQLSALHDGALASRDADEAARHVASCDACRTALAELEQGDAALAAALAHDPGDAFFARLAERIDRAVEQAAASPAPARRGGGLAAAWAWLMSPRGLAIGGAAAVVVAGAAVVLVTSRQVEMRSLRDPAIASRDQQVAPAPAAGRAADESRATMPQESAEPRAATPAAPREDAVDDAAAPEVAADAALPPGAPGASAAAGAREESRGQASPTTRATRVQERERTGEPRQNRAPAASSPAPAPSLAPPPAPAAAQVQSERAPRKPEAAPFAVAPPGDAAKEGTAEAKQREAPATVRDAVEGARRSAPGAASEGASLGATQAPPPAASGLDDSGNAAKRFQKESLSSPATIARYCGVVRDASGHAVAGAQAVLADLGRTTRTGADGRFCFDAPTGDHTLTVMAVGFETVRRSIRIEVAAAGAEVTLRAVEVLRGGRSSEQYLQVQMPDSFAAWPQALREPARRAEEKVAKGIQSRSASAIDQGAADWARIVERARGGDFEVAARERLGEARYLAWEADPTPARSRAAVEALTSYLTRAPMGPARERAAQRLDRVRR